MNNNGPQNRDNLDVDSYSEGQSRYRGNQRRSRGRNNYDRSQAPLRGNRRSNPHSHTNQNANQWRDTQTVSHPHRNPQVIDVDDDIQFPSIMETTNGAPRRPKPTQPQVSQDRRPPSPIQDVVQPSTPQYQLPSNARSTYTYHDAPAVSYNQSRYYGGNTYRGRSNRYNGATRGYTNNYARRPNRYPSSTAFNPIQPFITDRMPTTPFEYPRDRPEIDCIHQVEYYFSDSNLVYDYYLRNNMDENGFVPLSLVHCFKRITALKLSLDEFITRLKDSNMLEIDSNLKRIRVRADHEKWVNFNKYIKDNNLDDIPASEYGKHYQQFMKDLYGPHVHIPSNVLNPPQPRTKIFPAPYVATQYVPLSYPEPMPYYSFPSTDPSIMYSLNNPYVIPQYSGYTEYNTDYYIDPNYYHDSNSYQIRPLDQQEYTPQHISTNLESMMDNIRLEDRQNGDETSQNQPPTSQ